VSTTGVHKSEKKEVCGQPTVEARARTRDGSRSRWGALAEQGEAGSGGVAPDKKHKEIPQCALSSSWHAWEWEISKTNDHSQDQFNKTNSIKHNTHLSSFQCFFLLIPPDPVMTDSSMRFVALAVLAVQNSSLAIVMNIATQKKFFKTTANLWSELLKFGTCMAMIQSQDPRGALTAVAQDVLSQPMEVLKISVPALLYVFQNNIAFYAQENLDAATYQITYQLKILTTAVLSVLILNKSVSKLQWFSLAVLTSGVALVQYSKMADKPSDDNADGKNPLLGLAFVMMACCSSGLAAVWFESMLKGGDGGGTKKKVFSLWIRNVQMSIPSIIISFLSLITDLEGITAKGYHHNYTIWTVLAIFLMAFGGLVTALVVKYADNILKGFATSFAIIISCVISILFMGFELTYMFSFGVVLVSLATYLYGRKDWATVQADLGLAKRTDKKDE
jgi:UDP-sugar transporter A1/2/3